MMTSREIYLQFKENEPLIKQAASDAGIVLGDPLTFSDQEFDISGLQFLAEVPSPPPCGACGKPVTESPPIILWREEGRLAAFLHHACAAPRFPKSTKGFAA